MQRQLLGFIPSAFKYINNIIDPTLHPRESQSMPSPIRAEYLSFAQELADTARQVLAEHTEEHLGTSVKADKSLVTQMDVLIEERMRAQIEARFPAHGIIGEEHPRHNPGASHTWVLDPIDGTAHFVAGLPTYGTLIALVVDGVSVLGVIDAPAVGLRWQGALGHPSTCNGRVIRTRACPDLSQALFMAGNRDRFTPEQIPALDALRGASATNVYGGACWSNARVADGRVDLALDAWQGMYDFAPFRPIIEGAGGVTSDLNGQPLTLTSDGNVLTAGCAALHRQALEQIQAHLMTPPV